MTAVYAISANRPGYTDYFVVPPSSSYRSPSWMSYPPEPEDLPHQWNDTVKVCLPFSISPDNWSLSIAPTYFSPSPISFILSFHVRRAHISLQPARLS